MTIKSWTNKQLSTEALMLPEGTLVANFSGVWDETSYGSAAVLEAAQAFIEKGIDIEVFSQASLLFEAKKEGIAFEDWAELAVM